MRTRAVVAAVSVLVPVCCALLAPRPAAQCATSYLLTGSPQFGQTLFIVNPRANIRPVWQRGQRSSRPSQSARSKRIIVKPSD